MALVPCDVRMSCAAISGRINAARPDLANIAAVPKAATIVDAPAKVEHCVYGNGGLHLPMIPLMN
jgi:hypothetical protein